MTIFEMMLWAFVAAFSITGLVVLVMLLRPWDLLSPKTSIGQKNRHRIRVAYNTFAIGLFRALSSFPLTHIFVENLSASLKHMFMLDTDDAKVRATSLLMKEALITIASLIITIIYFDDTLLAFITTIMVAVYAYQKLMGDGQKFLEQLEEGIGDMVHIYNAEGQNIDMMFIRLLKDTDAYLYRYIDQMYTYLKRAITDPENSQQIISEYNSIVPSRHLRLVFNYVYITARYGDETNQQGEQLFNKNMLAIQREVHADLVKLKTIKDETLGEQVFIILGVVIIPAATWYMKTFFVFEGFESIGRFLNSSFGYAIKIVCAVFALLCFYVYNRISKSNTAFEQYHEIKWAEYTLKKNPWLKKIIDKLAPKEGTARRKKLENDITLSEGYVGVRPLYMKKLLTATIVTAIVACFLCFDTYTMYMGITSDIYRGVDRSLMDTVLLVEDFPDEYKQRSLSNDMMVVDILRENEDEYFALPTDQEEIGYIMEIIDDYGFDYGAYPDVAAQRIHEKFVQLNQLDPLVIFLVILFTLVASYNLPNLTMKLNLMLNHGAIIYDEVMGCYTVVILLINHSSSNVYMILNWLASFANVFKTRLQQCIDNLSEKEIRSLEEGVNYKPFSRLIECILMAYNGTDLQSAFAGIEQRHLFQEESRRMINQQAIKRRVSYSQLLSWGALGCTFILYIVAPMVLAIIEMLGQLL